MSKGYEDLRVKKTEATGMRFNAIATVPKAVYAPRRLWIISFFF
jgi:hypothetical protein